MLQRQLPHLAVGFGLLTFLGHGAFYVFWAQIPAELPGAIVPLVLSAIAGVVLFRALNSLHDDDLAAALACWVLCLVPVLTFEATRSTEEASAFLATAGLIFAAARWNRVWTSFAAVAGASGLILFVGPGAPAVGLTPYLLIGPLIGLGALATVIPAVRSKMRPNHLLTIRLSALSALGLLSLRASDGVPVAGAGPIAILATTATLPAIIYALRELPNIKSIVIWMALPTVMYCLFWVAMMPIRPHLYPFTMTSWGS